MAEKIRLDVSVFKKNLTSSLREATALIMAGKVIVNGKIITKPGFSAQDSDKIFIKESKEFVSRGGIKLKKILEEFAIDVKNKVCLDVGASTGGFTDCLLKNGAKKVYCVDVGYGILDFKLRNDPRVVNIEKTNIRYFGKRELTRIIQTEFSRMKQSGFGSRRLQPAGVIPPHLSLREVSRCPSGETEAISKIGSEDVPQSQKMLESSFPDLATVDVSFISLEKVLSKVKELVKQGGEIIALVKPQFEAPKGSTKKGVVDDEDVRNQVIERIKNFSKGIGLKLLGETTSPVKGPKGNLEHFLYFKV